jgi:acyl-CoA thioesterase FadM
LNSTALDTLSHRWKLSQLTEGKSSMTGPMQVFEIEIPAAWVDYNHHLNDAYHTVAFSLAGDAFMERIGLGPPEREATGRTIYTLGLIIRYVAEAKLGERLSISLQVLETDSKRMRVWMEARRVGDETLVSTTEQVFMCVDRTAKRPRAADFPTEMAATLQIVAADHAKLPVPLEAGQGLALRRRSVSSVTP